MSVALSLYGLVQVLLACVKCPGGSLLTNDNVINIFQACFRIGHNDAHKVPNGELCSVLTAARLLSCMWPGCTGVRRMPASAWSLAHTEIAGLVLLGQAANL